MRSRRGRPARPGGAAARGPRQPAPVARAAELPDPRDPRLLPGARDAEARRSSTRASSAATAQDVDGDDFTHPPTARCGPASRRRAAPRAADAQWASKLRDTLTDERLQSLSARSPSSRCTRARSRRRPTSPARLPAAASSPPCGGSPTSSRGCSGPTRSSRRRSTTGCSASSSPSSSTAAPCASRPRRAVRLFDRSGEPPAEVLVPRRLAARREGARLRRRRRRHLAARHAGGWLVLPVGTRTPAIPWEQVENADWDQDADAAAPSPRSGSTASRGRSHALVMDDHPALLLQLVRERVTASVVLQRRVPVRGKRRRDGDRSTQPGGRPDRRGCTPTTGSGPGRSRGRRRGRPGPGPGAGRGGRRRRPTRRAPDLASPAALLAFAGAIPCSSIGRAFDC